MSTEASKLTYSIIATAMSNNLDPFEYLTHIFRRAPNIDMEDTNNLQSLLPWNVNMTLS